VLYENKLNVPKFIVLDSIKKYTPVDNFVLSDKVLYAVRSSCDVEDGDKESCAGKYKTILNVEKNKISDAVEDVFNSMKNDNQTGCVIIQEMVDSDFSGVVFTANPVSGILNETVIVIGEGLGNNVVDDKTNTTTYFHNQDDGIYYYEQTGNSPLLSENILIEILNNAEKIKNIFNKPMDIEFAIKDNIVYILQARPITTFKTNKPIILDNSNIVESYPDISLPLTQSFVKEIYHDIFYKCTERITKDKDMPLKMDAILQDMIQSVNWRIYYQIDNWYSFLRLLPFSNKIISIWQEMLGVDNRLVSDNIGKVSLKTKLTVLGSVIYFLRKTPKYMTELNHNFNGICEKYRNKIKQANTIPSLLNIYEDIKKEILSDWDITLVNDMYTFIYTSLAGNKNKVFISDIKDLESMKPLNSLETLVKIAKEYGIDSENYKKAKDKHIDLYGDRCLGELKLETKTYRTNPELLDKYIQENITKKDIEHHTTQAVTPKCKNIFVKKAKIGIENREISRLNRSRIFGVVRSIFIKIGEILYNENKIEKIDDVFYLYKKDLTESDIDFKQLIFDRKEIEKRMKDIPPYSRLVFNEKISDKVIFNNNNISIINNSKELKGTPTSVGIVEGEVLIVNEPNENIDTTDKILVTKSTDPGWVFLIKNAKGIIAEKGSLLSHTAIISRELKKPAIVNVKDCTTILHNGDKVLLNSETGNITILQK
jgi:pyruvate,water dikinase